MPRVAGGLDARSQTATAAGGMGGGRHTRGPRDGRGLSAEVAEAKGAALLHVRPVEDELDGGVLAIVEVGQQLGREEEVLLAAVAAGVRDALEDVALVGGVHRLVDLVDDSEGGGVDVLQGDEVDHRGDGALAARVAAELSEHVQLLGRAPLHLDVDLVLRVVVRPVRQVALGVALAPIGQDHLARALEAREARGEVPVDEGDHLLQLGLPLGLERGERGALLGDLLLRLLDALAHLGDLLLTLLVLLKRVLARAHLGGGLGLEDRDLVLEIVEAGGHLVPQLLCVGGAPNFSLAELRRLGVRISLELGGEIGRALGAFLELVLLGSEPTDEVFDVLRAVLGLLELLLGSLLREVAAVDLDGRVALGGDDARQLLVGGAELLVPLQQLSTLALFLRVGVEVVHLVLCALDPGLELLDPRRERAEARGHRVEPLPALSHLLLQRLLFVHTREEGRAVRRVLLEFAFGRIQVYLALRADLGVDGVGEDALHLARHRRGGEQRLVAVARARGGVRARRREDAHLREAARGEEGLQLGDAADGLLGGEEEGVDLAIGLEEAEHLVSQVLGDGEGLVEPGLDPEGRHLGGGGAVRLGRVATRVLVGVDVGLEPLLLGVAVENVSRPVVSGDEVEGLPRDGLLGECGVALVLDVDAHDERTNDVLLAHALLIEGEVGEGGDVRLPLEDHLLLALARVVHLSQPRVGELDVPTEALQRRVVILKVVLGRLQLADGVVHVASGDGERLLRRPAEFLLRLLHRGHVLRLRVLALGHQRLVGRLLLAQLAVDALQVVLDAVDRVERRLHLALGSGQLACLGRELVVGPLGALDVGLALGGQVLERYLLVLERLQLVGLELVLGLLRLEVVVAPLVLLVCRSPLEPELLALEAGDALECGLVPVPSLDVLLELLILGLHVVEGLALSPEPLAHLLELPVSADEVLVLLIEVLSNRLLRVLEQLNGGEV
mmetsp:Transcript_14695/g.31872  ORF Transcript_14695/g.31872 Transcript_14695/m.31872 type:complete len:957 (+) Transcript_14695:308-3178(+)